MADRLWLPFLADCLHHLFAPFVSTVYQKNSSLAWYSLVSLDESTQTVRVGLGERGYDIVVGSGTLASAAERIIAATKLTHAVIISDTNVGPLYAEQLSEQLSGSSVRTTRLTVPAGEPSKSVAELSRLWNESLADNADRSSVVIAVGGGVVGDLAGFVAASFARGLRFVQVPTSLLAQVDSSVGGKVGINLPGAKNIVGAFWQPQLVVIDTDVLSTLPARELSAGLAEVIKYGVIADESFFADLEADLSALLKLDPTALRKTIVRCCEIKSQVVEEDERETSGRRAILNYGHTFGHALEAITGYDTYLHGEAIAIGMTCAARLAADLGRIDAAMVDRQTELFQAAGLPTEMPEVDTVVFLGLMNRDKKVEHGKLRLILPDRMGNVELVDEVDEQAIIGALG